MWNFVWFLQWIIVMIMMMVVVVVVAMMMMMMMMIKIMIINNFLNGDERHEDGWKLCRFLLKICPKRLNFVGFFEEKILTPPPLPPFENLPSLEGCEWEMERSTGPSLPPRNGLFWNFEPRPKRASKVDLTLLTYIILYIILNSSRFRKRQL